MAGRRVRRPSATVPPPASDRHAPASPPGRSPARRTPSDGSDTPILVGYRRSLGVPAYRRLWLAAVVSKAGDAFNVVALQLFVYGVTGSVRAVALNALVGSSCLIAGAAAAQIVVDRVAPRTLLISLDLVRAAAALTLASIATFPTALAVTAVLAFSGSSFGPTSAALVPRLVGTELLPSANALQSTAGAALQLVGAPLAGLLLVVASPRVAFGLNAASFLGSALILRGLPRLPGLAAASAGPWRQLPEAVRAVRAGGVLLPLLGMQALAALSVGATSALLVVLARSGYGLGSTGYGLWVGAIGLGSVLGALVVPALSRLPPHRTMSGAYVMRGGGDVLLGVLHQGVPAGALLAVYGMNVSSGTVSLLTLVHREVPEEMRGRAFALLDVVWQVGRLVSIAIGGVLAGVIGIRALFGVGGALLTVAGLCGGLGLAREVDRCPKRGGESNRPETDGTVSEISTAGGSAAAKR